MYLVVFIFGDLFVDNGNNNYLVLLVWVNFLLNGCDYGSGIVIGCFCNGFILLDYIGIFEFLYNVICCYLK